MTTAVAAETSKALADVPFGSMLTSLALAIVDAQHALDMSSLRMAQALTGEYEDSKQQKVSTLISFDGQQVSLLELGFTPTFYHFVETTIEMKISVSMSTAAGESSFNFGGGLDASGQYGGSVTAGSAPPASPGNQPASPAPAGSDSQGASGQLGGSAALSVAAVGASYSSKFQYSAEGSSSVKVRLVPVPAPALLEERLRRILDRRKRP